MWRQLKDSNLQTQIMHRETLAIRLREAEERAARVAKAIDDPLWKAQDVTSDPEGEPLEISEHDAFGVEQMIEGRLDWYLVTLGGTEDAPVEAAKAALKVALKDADIAELKTMQEEFGLHVQVFRKSGNTWLETSTSDDLTLEDQNFKGKESQRHHFEQVDPLDYREQD